MQKRNQIFHKIIKRVGIAALAVCTAVALIPGNIGKVQAGNSTVNSLPGATGSLYSGRVYSVTSTTTIDARGYAGSSGLYVASGATVVLYIAPGVTLNVYGGNGSYSTPGGAGIYIPSNSTLIVTGGGALYAHGGSAGSGGNGTGGYSGYLSTRYNEFQGGSGGSGGAGGGGAGAGIGGSGGQGGAGGYGGSSSKYTCNYGTDISGSNGGSGSSGGTGSSMGYFYALGSVQVYAYGGGGASGGSGGSSGGYANDAGSGWENNYSASGGGGGGGGAGGYSASAIGGGAAGGGGGAGGGSGAVFTSADTHSYHGGYGGDGGYGNSSGSSGSSARQDSYAYKWVHGGYGGSRGYGGSSGSSGYLYRSTSAYVPSRGANGTTNSHWAIQYSIYLDGQGATYAGSTSTTATYYLSMPNITVPTKTGYTFGGYYTSSGGSGTQYYNSSGVGTRAWNQFNNQTLYAKWTANKYTVTLDADGGSGGSSVAATYNSTMPTGAFAPAKSGYIFGGYYAEKDGKGTCYYNASLESQTTYDIASSTTLYAKWTPIKYDIEIYSNGSYVSKLENVSYGTFILPTSTDLELTRNHYEFMGWNMYDAQNWAMYQPNTVYNTGLTTQNGKTVTVYAAWQMLDNYLITYNGNGGTGIPNTGNVFAGEDYTVDSKVPTRDKYTFLGWSEDASATTATYQPEAKISSVSQAKTLYAIWKMNPSVSYNANGGSFSDYIEKAYYPEGNMVNVSFDEDASNPNLTRTGYNFLGWAKSKNVATPDYKTDGTKSFKMPASDVTLYAVWEAKTLQITYSTLSGFYDYTLNPATTTYGAEYSFKIKVAKKINSDDMVIAINGNALVTPKPEVDTNGNKEYTFTISSPTENQNVLVNGCSKQKYTVRLHTNDGELEQQCTEYTAGTAVTLPTEDEIAKTGYTFKGWYESKTLEGSLVTAIGETETGDKDYYAKWEANTYKVTYDANGGEGSMDEQNHTYDKAQVLTKHTFTHGTYEFLGWSTNKDATTAEYLDESTVTNISKKDDVTLYAVWNLPTYTVSYNSNKGTGGDQSRMYKSGVDADVVFVENQMPTRAGYTFAGWAERADVTSPTYTKDGTKTITSISGNHVLYAVWTPKSYKITFDGNGADSGSMDDEGINYDESKALTSVEFAKEADSQNPKFLGWSASKEAIIPTYLDGQKVKNLTSLDDNGNPANITLYAVWGTQEVNYLNYDANGGTWGSSGIPDTDPGESGIATVQFNKLPTKSGYVFSGWKTGDTTYTEDGVDKIIDLTAGSKTLYAVWTEKEYTATFNTNGGEGVVENQILTYDTVTSLTSLQTLNFAKAGYIFRGWATNNEGDAVYQDAQPVINLPTDNNDQIALYATWELSDTKTLVFNANGGSGGPAGGSYLTDSDQNIDFTKNPTRSGYTFLGWDKDPSAKAAAYKDEDGSKTITMTANTTLYAVWQEKVSYTITYDADGGTGSVPVDVNKYNDGDQVVIPFTPQPTKSGYTFDGWTFDGTDYKENTTEGGDPTSITIGTKNIIFKANWNPVSYKVVFHNTDDDTSKEQSLTYGVKAALNKNSFTGRVGYDFEGWSFVPNGGKVYEDEAEVESLANQADGEVNLYTVWKAKEAAITFDNGDGGQKPTAKSIFGEPLPTTALTVPGKKGYIFKGYYSEANGEGTKYYTEELNGTRLSDLTANTTLYAKWEAIKYDITYMQDGTEVSVKKVAYDDVFDIATQSSVSKLEIPAGYKLAGWTTNGNDLTVREYTPGQTLSENQLYKDGSNVMLYAVVKKDETFQVTYDGNGGRNVPSDETQYEENAKVDVVLDEKPVLQGYNFQGWSIDSKAEDVTYAVGGTTSFAITKNTKLYAVWATNTYTIHYDSNGGTGEIANQTADFTNIAYELDSGTGFTRTGYTLKGWGIASSGHVIYNLSYELQTPLSSKENGKVTLYAIWEAIDYNVTFNAEGGNLDNNVVGYTYGKMYGNLPEPTRKGYTFQGWYSDEGYREKITGTTMMDTPSAHTLYAKWEAQSYTVTYDSNGGEGNIAKQTIEFSDIAAKLSDGMTLTKEGYTLVGWSTSAGGNVQYDLGYVAAEPLSNKDGGEAQLYAVWKANSYQVTFEGNQGIPDNKQISYTYDAAYGNLPLATRNGYTFKGWYLDEKLTERVTTTTKVTTAADHILYAKWEVQSYTVDYEVNGGNGTIDNQTVEFSDTSSRLDDGKALSRIGYTLMGWSTSANGSVQYSLGYAVKEHLTKTDGAVIQLYAVWKANLYEVTFNPRGGTVDNGKVKYDYDSTYGTMPSAKRNGYTFKGWYLDEELTIPVTSTTKVTTANDHTLYANWVGETFSTNVELDAKVLINKQLPAKIYSGKFTVLLKDSSNRVLQTRVNEADGMVHYDALRFTSTDVDRTYTYYISEKMPAKGDELQSIVYDATIRTIEITIKEKPDGSLYTIQKIDGNDYTSGGALFHNIKHEHNVIYNKNSKYTVYEMPSDKSIYLDGDQATVLGKPISKSRFFIGWNTKKDGSGKSYQAGSKINMYQDTTLYAQWGKVRTTSDKLKYTVSGKYQIRCIGTANKKAVKIDIPETITYKGITYKVTSIKKKAFINDGSIKSLIIGENVVTIGDKAFYNCKKLSKITVGSSVKDLGMHPFCFSKNNCTIILKSKKISKVKTSINHATKGMVLKVPRDMRSKYKKTFKKSKGLIIKVID